MTFCILQSVIQRLYHTLNFFQVLRLYATLPYDADTAAGTAAAAADDDDDAAMCCMKADAVHSKSFVTHGAADVKKIVGVRQDKSSAKNTHRTLV